MSKPNIIKSICLAILFMALATGMASKVEARESADWKCGDWIKDQTGKCEEVRICTRLDCPIVGGKIDTSRCVRRTKTECANPRTPQVEHGGDWRDRFRRRSITSDDKADRFTQDMATTD